MNIEDVEKFVGGVEALVASGASHKDHGALFRKFSELSARMTEARDNYTINCIKAGSDQKFIAANIGVTPATVTRVKQERARKLEHARS